jgi:hypothetical protein
VSDSRINQESQAISGFNGPGNWLIENNYLEAATQNFLIGGSDPPIPNLVTTHVVFRSNYLSKQLAWRDPILAAPANVAAATTPAAGALPVGTYSYQVAARKLSNQIAPRRRSRRLKRRRPPSPRGDHLVDARGGLRNVVRPHVEWRPCSDDAERVLHGYRAAGMPALGPPPSGR